MNDIPSSSIVSHPLVKPNDYGATQYSSSTLDQDVQDSAIIQPLINEDTWHRNTRTHTRRPDPSIRSRQITNRQNNKPLILCLLRFFYHLHCWICDVLFILGSVVEDEDYDDVNSEGESSHDRMTATTSSVSRHLDTNNTLPHQHMNYSSSSIPNNTPDKRTKNYLQDETDHLSILMHTDHRHRSTSPTQLLRNLKKKHGKKRIGRVVWLLLLALAYSMERCTFKILLDRMGPFRLVVGTQGIMALYIILLGIGMLWTIFSFGGKRLLSQICGKKRHSTTTSAHSTYSTLSEYIANAFLMDPNSKIVYLPLVDLGMIAVFDSLSILLAALSASHTTPILIIILVQLNVPLSVISRYFCVDRLPISTNATISQSIDEEVLEQVSKKKRNKMTLLRNIGACIILLSVIFSLLPIYFPTLDPTQLMFHVSSLPYIDTMTMWNTALFAFSCLPAAASQAYKYHALVETAQNVHATLMNFILSVTSLILIILLSPLVYSLQGLGTPVTDDMNVTQWIELYPSYTYSSNFQQSVKCIFGTISNEIQLSGYPEVAQCQYSWLLVLIHVLSILLVQYALEKMCASGAPRLIGHSMSWGIFFGSTYMFLYGEYNHSSLIFWIGCILILILGSELYQQTSVKIDTFETVYANPCGDDATITET